MSRNVRIYSKPSSLTTSIASAMASAAAGSAAVLLAMALATQASPVASAAAKISYARLLSSTITRIPPGTSLSSVHPAAGRTYAFKRGATYTGTLTITADNVTIRNYGTGRYPVLTRGSEGNIVSVSGANDHVANVRLVGQGYQSVPGCGAAKTAGYEVGIDITGSHDSVNAVIAYGDLYAGIYVETAGSFATISGSEFNHVNGLNPGNLGAGAFGILLWGSHNTITRDKFLNQTTCSPDFGTDGSGVEIYHGSNNLIEHSTGANDSDFTELGGAGATTNSYVDNTFSGPGEFLVTRGSGDSADGPVRNTILTGNVAHGKVVSYDYRSGDGTLLTMRNNHVTSLSQDGGYVDQGGNTFGF